jgi:hypothetical protein
LPGLFCSMGRICRPCPLKYRDVFQQGNHAEDDYDDARDLLGAAIDRQQIDQVENKNNDHKRDQRTDKHPEIPFNGVRSDFDPASTRGPAPGSGQGTGALAFNIF